MYMLASRDKRCGLVRIFKDGQEVNRSVGMVPKDKLLAMIK